MNDDKLRPDTKHLNSFMKYVILWVTRSKIGDDYG